MPDQIDQYFAGRAAIEDVLASSPDEDSRDFELMLTRLAACPEKRRLTRDLRMVLDSGDTGPVGYAAFYCLNILLRRNRDVTLLEELINQYSSVFKRHETFQHLMVLLNIEKGLGRRGDEIIAAAYDDSLRFADNAGFVHLFAVTVAAICEEMLAVRDRVAAEWLDKALDAADRAIALDRRYAKYYCTKGRLLAIGGQFEDAVSQARVAIDAEDSSKPDYAIRIGDYQYYLLRIQAAKNEADLAAKLEAYGVVLAEKLDGAESKINEGVKRMDDSSIRNLEFLGFFAALISFTIGSIQLAVSQQASDLAGLIVVLFGALLVAFGGFTFIVRRDPRAWRHALPLFVAGLVAVAVGHLLCSP